MSRKTTGFTLEQKNIDWLKDKAKSENRSVSNMLDRLIEKLMYEETNGR